MRAEWAKVQGTQLSLRWEREISCVRMFGLGKDKLDDKGGKKAVCDRGGVKMVGQ